MFARLKRRATKATRRSGLHRLVSGPAPNPYADSQPRLIVHTAHHKVGTSWFSAIFRALSEHYDMPLARDPAQVDTSGRSIFMQHRVLAEPKSFSNYRGSHMIRDPRDVAISGYHYHLWTQEPWCNKKIAHLPEVMRQKWHRLPLAEIGHLTYKEYLNLLSPEEGLSAEIDRCSNTVNKDIMEWDYDDPNIFEFRYEDIILDEPSILEKLFTHYGFTDSAVRTACEIASRFSFANRTGRDIGDEVSQHHIRSGKLEQWRTAFNDDHKALFKELHGEDLIKLGYAKDLDW